MARPFLRIFGRFRADGHFEPGRGWETHRLATRAVGNPEFALELWSQGKAKVATGVVEIPKPILNALCSTASARLTGHVVLHRDAALLTLRHGDRIFHEVPVSACAPQIGDVQVALDGAHRLRLVWMTKHELPLTFNVVVVDSQHRAISIARELTESQYTQDVQDLSVGGECSFVVLATDGVRSCFARSNMLDLPIKPPSLTIATPTAGSVLTPDEPFSLQGYVVNPGGSASIEGRLNWSVDGKVVSAGGLLALAPALPPGDHLISVSLQTGSGEIIHCERQISVAPRSAARKEWVSALRSLSKDTCAGE